MGVVVGNPVADEVRLDGVPIRRACGGTATYATLALRALGLDAMLIGAVGVDHADMLRAPLAAAGVDLSALREDADPSTAYILDYASDTRERTVRLQHGGPPVREADVPPPPPGAAFVHVGAVAGEVLPETVVRLASWGIPVGIDLHALRRFSADGAVRLGDAAAAGLDFGLFDTIKGAFDEIRAFDGSAQDLVPAMHAIAARGVRHVLATDGCQGALLLVDGCIEPVPAFPVREVDATGAGDVFLAGFLAARHARGESARDAARFGAAAASFVVEGPGTSCLGDLAAVLARRAALATA